MIAFLAAINFLFVGVFLAALIDTGNPLYIVCMLINALAGFFILSND